jgi:hypothetical protein
MVGLGRLMEEFGDLGTALVHHGGLLVLNGDGVADSFCLHMAAKGEMPAARGVPEVGRLSCCAFVFVDEAAEDVTAVELPRCG